MPQPLPPETHIVFDTNVLISAFIYKQTPGEVYQYCAERYILYPTEWLLDELQDVLARKKFRLPSILQYEIIQQVRADARLVFPNNNLPSDSIDPDDNNVLRAARFVNAEFLITGDAKHLLSLKRVADTEIISSREFYERYIA